MIYYKHIQSKTKIANKAKLLSILLQNFIAVKILIY